MKKDSTSFLRIKSFSGLSLMLFFLVFGIGLSNAQEIKKEDYVKMRTFKMTTLSFGGNGVSITKINNHFTVMTGGKGSATFNNRYTIGGGGWGMIKGAPVESNTEGIYQFVKLGYGGIDFGYLVLNGEKFMLGTKLLIGGGAVFKETIPESKSNGFKLLPVLEPTVYYQISLNKLFRIEMGAGYRYVWGTNLPYISDNNLGGFSFYVGFLASACKSN